VPPLLSTEPPAMDSGSSDYDEAASSCDVDYETQQSFVVRRPPTEVVESVEGGRQEGEEAHEAAFSSALETPVSQPPESLETTAIDSWSNEANRSAATKPQPM